MYILIDNYDSFTYNLYQYLSELTDRPVRVFRNDETSVGEIEALDPAGIVISPGPGRPEDAGVSVELIRHFAGRVPILGVCLGLQAIGYAFGASIVQARRIVHGKVEEIELDGRGIFRAIPSPCRFTRYHSLAVDEATLPAELEVTARSRDGDIMGLRHREYPIEGVQFHPESAASDYGKRLIRNFLAYRREPFQGKSVLLQLMSGKHMSREQAEGFMEELTEGNLSESRIAAFLTAMAIKGAVPDEIAGCAAVLQRKRAHVRAAGPLLDTCGTGGDGRGTFNISSLAAIAASACGARVAKHGNRAVSSQSGSADFYGELGIDINLDPEQAADLLDGTGFAFLFAPVYHGAMKYAAPVRRELAIKTVMNLLGPLVNPAGAEYQLIGVFDEKFCVPVAQAAHLLGARRAMVVHSFDGIDEISVSAPTTLVTVDEEGQIEERVFRPEEIGIGPYRLEEILGGNAEENARIAVEILNGGGSPAVRDAVALNAGAALAVYGSVPGIAEGYRAVLEAFADGRVAEKLARIAERSRSYRKPVGARPTASAGVRA